MPALRAPVKAMEVGIGMQTPDRPVGLQAEVALVVSSIRDEFLSKIVPAARGKQRLQTTWGGLGGPLPHPVRAFLHRNRPRS